MLEVRLCVLHRCPYCWKMLSGRDKDKGQVVRRCTTICTGDTFEWMYVLSLMYIMNIESAKELWDSLESKYMEEDSSSKKFLNFCSHLRIEESLRAQDSDKGNGKEVAGPSVNMTEEETKVGMLRNGARSGHFKEGICRSGNKKTQMAGSSGKGVDAIAWWIDFGATTHVCKDRCWFKTYEPVEDGSVLYMGDDHFAPIHGKGNVVLKVERGKSSTLFNVLYVPKLRIIHETTAPYTPQQNSVAERKNKALKKMVNSMLSYSGLSEGFWGDAMAVVRLPDPKRKTLGEKGIDCIFVGYAEHSKAYMFYVIEPNDSVSINSIIESRDAIFDENRFSLIPRPKDIIPNSNESQRDDHSDDIPSEVCSPQMFGNVHGGLPETKPLLHSASLSKKDDRNESPYSLQGKESQFDFLKKEINHVLRLYRDLNSINDIAMAEEDAFLVDNVEGGLCVDYTDAIIVGRCYSGRDKDKGKELWDSLESKYMEEDSSSKKFLVSNFNNYKMVNSRPVMEQYNELLRILG
ncbi:zinc finger, CCHC-type containing protein [Tanacetum coccineum]|uniref:Zinc finger, CCHC-type containing protein n=1 Tax=Tanacetum coccineum TaxID=301880 RepID=A0ABQ5IJC9_9ASTR